MTDYTDTEKTRTEQEWEEIDAHHEEWHDYTNSIQRCADEDRCGGRNTLTRFADRDRCSA